MWVVHKGRKTCGGTFGEMKCRKVRVKMVVGGRWMDETGYRMNKYDILAFCLCLIRISEAFQLYSRVRERDI